MRCSIYQKASSKALINGETAALMQSRSSAMPFVAQHGYAKHDVEDGPIARIGQRSSIISCYSRIGRMISISNGVPTLTQSQDRFTFRFYHAKQHAEHSRVTMI